MSVRRRPDSILTGEILPPERSAPHRHPTPYRTPEVPTLADFGGVFNIVARLRARSQTKGYKALDEQLRAFESALQAQEGVARALERLEIQEERLHPQNLDILREAERRNVDATLADAEHRLHDAQARGRKARLQADIDEFRLLEQREKAARRYERLLDSDTGGGGRHEASGASSEEDELSALGAKLAAAQKAYEASDNEAEQTRLKHEISMILAEMEAVRHRHASKL